MYSIPKSEFKEIDEDRNAQLAKALSLYSDRKISDVQNQLQVLEHMMQNFSEILCIKYAMVNPWAMIGGTNQ